MVADGLLPATQDLAVSRDKRLVLFNPSHLLTRRIFVGQHTVVADGPKKKFTALTRNSAMGKPKSGGKRKEHPESSKQKQNGHKKKNYPNTYDG